MREDARACHVIDLRTALAEPPLFTNGLRRVPYDLSRCDLRTEVANHLVKAGFCSAPIVLEDLHLHISKKDQIPLRGPLNAAAISLATPPLSLMQAYHRLIEHLARDHLRFDFVFEATPITRIFFPGPYHNKFRTKAGVLLNYHTDMMFGDFPQQINCWLPLTRCHGTNALQCAAFEPSIQILSAFSARFDFNSEIFMDSRQLFFETLAADLELQKMVLESCTPLKAEFGEILLFDARLIHGASENRETETRVSLDFRILPLDTYRRLIALHESAGTPIRAHCGIPLARGAFYDERSAYQL